MTAKTSYSVEVRATDPFAAFATVGADPLPDNADIITVDIAVTNVQEAPEFTAGETEVAYPEPTTDGRHFGAGRRLRGERTLRILPRPV